MKDILVIGLGEIGSALIEIEEGAGNRVFKRDLDIEKWTSNESGKYDICHIAIPFKKKEQFISDVGFHMLSYSADVTIIHSTVEVGTTRALIQQTGNKMVVHSFVRGVHPNLVKGIKTFEKMVSGIEEVSILNAIKHFESLGIQTKYSHNTEESELAKLLSTTYYGWNILFAKMAKELCDENHVDYDTVYKWANNSYNEGYKKLGKNNVVRPILYPPEENNEGKRRILGHCVVPNFHLLPDSTLKDFCISEEQR